MSIDIKKVMSIFLMVTNARVCAMEEKLVSSQELRTSQELKTSQSLSPYTFSFSLPTLTNLSNGVNSLIATATNYLSDDAAFIKLGWPSSNEQAQQELKNTQETYKRVTDSLQNNVRHDDFVKDYEFLNRRQYYCQRVLQALPHHPKGLELAIFCLQHHRSVMNSFDLTRFWVFVEAEQKKSEKASKEFSLLTILPEVDNQSLDKLFKQTLAVKKYSKDSVEEKKDEDSNNQKENDKK